MNILVLTSNYKGDDLPKETTEVVHYFTKEWAASGHNVVVIHNQTVFPWYVNWVLSVMKKILFSIRGISFVTKKIKDRDYFLDGVRVSRLTMKKIIPRRSYSSKSYERQVDRIKKKLYQLKFRPDVIVGHWQTPQIKLINELKPIYNVPTALVVHEVFPILKREHDDWAELVKGIDLWGFRSDKIKKAFLNTYDVKDKPYFMSYSGFPEESLPAGFVERKSQSSEVYTFVGNMIQRKYPELLLKSLLAISPQAGWQVNYIGEGLLLSKLKQLAAKAEIIDRVNFLGRIARKDVFKVLEKSDVFVMISWGETFGLVYLEAMANGCIAIGAKGEGIDGIIEDGVNGFLCEAGNLEQLNEVLSKIGAMSQEERNTIALNGFMTARNFTDKSVASNYLNALLLIAEN